MTDLQSSPSASTPRHFSLRLSQKSNQRLSSSLRSRKEALDNLFPDGTPLHFKNYRKYKPRKLVNNFVKERNYYNNPDGIDLFDELSDDGFINDGSSSTSDSTQESSQSKSSSQSTSEDEENNKKAKKPITRKERNQRSLRRTAGGGSDSEEELARPLKAHKQRLWASLLSSSDEDSSGEDLPFPSQKKNRHRRVTIHSDRSSDEDQPVTSTQDPSKPGHDEVSQINAEIEVEDEDSIWESSEAQEGESKSQESISAASGSSSSKEPLAIKRCPSDDELYWPHASQPALSGSKAVLTPAPEIKIEVEKDPSSSSDSTLDSTNDSADSDDSESNGLNTPDYWTDSEDSFIATSSSSDDTPNSENDFSDTNKPSHEELICNYRQRKRHVKHPDTIKKRRIRLPSDSDSSCPSDHVASEDDKSEEHSDDGAITRLPSRRAERLRKKKKAWEREVLGTYKNQRERKISKK